MRTPLAWKNLTSDPRRLALACAGVAFAAVLMFMENGFQNALLDSPVQLLQMLRCDLVAVSTARYALPAEQAFPRTLLDRAHGDPEVLVATSLPIERMRAQVRVLGRARRPIRVVGVPLDGQWFQDHLIQKQLSLLRLPSAALLDINTRREYGFDKYDRAALAREPVELSGRDLRIVGTVDIGTDFANEGTLLVSHAEFARFFPFRGDGNPLSVVDLGLIRLKPGADAVEAANRLTDLAAESWIVLPREQLIDKEIQFWSRQTPIGIIFFVGSMMGFAVGVIICYQILFTSIHDALPEFATLKAMGYSSGFFVNVVIRQSVYLSLIGFVPALVFSWGLFELMEWLAGLPMLITVWRAALVLALTVLMCLVSGMLALRKLLRADPASLF